MRARRIVVIGGGLIGAASAYELAAAGEDVTLIDAGEIAHGASFANGGMMTPSMSDPWNSPGIAKTLLKSLLDENSTLRINPGGLVSMLPWALRFVAASTRQRHSCATLANFALARFSTERTRQLWDELDLEFAASDLGTMKIFADEDTMLPQLEHAQMLAPLGLRFELLNQEQAIDKEPALAHHTTGFSCALYYPSDLVGNARRFTEAMVTHAAELGAKVHRKTPVASIATTVGKVSGVIVDGTNIPATDVVIAAGHRSPEIARAVGVRLPIAPVKGYSVSFPGRQGEGQPKIAVVDEALHAAVVPIGDTLRVVGTAEFGSNDMTIPPARIENLYRLLAQIYPHISAGMSRESAVAWAGLRPMSADGVPLIGSAGPEGLWINAGHGHLGWTMAAGSAQLLTCLIQGKHMPIDPLPYRPIRRSSRS